MVFLCRQRTLICTQGRERDTLRDSGGTMSALGLHGSRVWAGLSVALCILTSRSLGSVGARGDVLATWGRSQRRGVPPPYDTRMFRASSL